MKQPIDLRVLKKHRSIKKAFYEAAALIPFEKISVEKVVTFAHIPTALFYQCYDNIKDLINNYRSELIQNLNDEINQSTLVSDNHSKESIKSNINHLLGYVKHHQLEFKVMFNNDSSNIMKEHLKKSIQLALMDNYQLNNNLSQSTHLYIDEMYATIIIKWIHQDCHESASELATLIMHLHQSMMVG